jgi:hypothetical protein
LGRRHVYGEIVPLAAFSRAQPTKTLLEGYRFERCVIEGPAILMLAADTRFIRPRFEPWDSDAVIWITNWMRPNHVGVVRAAKTVFDQCLFREVGVAMPESRSARFIEEVERGMADAAIEGTGLTSPPPLLPRS